MTWKANVYRLDVQVLDVGPEMPSIDSIIHEVESSKWLSISVNKIISTSNISNWDDDHPLNRKMTYEEYEKWWENNGTI